MAQGKKISKRTFLKYGFCSACGLMLGSPLLKAAGSSLNLIAGPDKDLWKWSTEAFYYIETPRGMKCKLCPQKCEIEEGKLGDCKTRIHHNGKLYSIAYGNPCAVHA